MSTTDTRRSYHRAGAVLDYGFDWSAWLNAGDALAESAWEVAPDETDGLALVVASDAVDGADTVVRVAGGVAGHEYRLTNTVTTAEGLLDRRTILVTVLAADG